MEQTDGAWMNPDNIQQTVIETVPGQPFEVNFQDLNVDGKEFLCKCALLGVNNINKDLTVFIFLVLLFIYRST